MSGDTKSTAGRRPPLVGRQSSQLSTGGDDEDEDFEVVYRVKSPAQSIPPNHRLPPAAEEILAHFDEFGSTPPRTRTRNKYRDWDQKQKFDPNAMRTRDGAACAAAGPGATGPAVGMKRMMRSRVNRRNTMDCALLNEMFVDDDCSNKFAGGDKRSKQLLRESERDMKRASMALIGPSASLSVVEATNVHLLGADERAESYPSYGAASGASSAGGAGAAATAAAALLSGTQSTQNGMAQPMLIKCSNPYKSVSTRPVGCRTSAPASAFPVFGSGQLAIGFGGDAAAAAAAATADECEDALTCRFDRSKLQVRREFHETFAMLIKLGSDKQDNRASNEIDTWQTELKDLIWLELQAWHAERTPEEQDRFLCAARKDVPKLLDKILHYRFKPSYLRETSTDSGISSASESKDSTMELNTGDNITLAGVIASLDNTCKKCLSLYCKDCQQQQCTALREVEELLTRLEAAEALYPSSQVMGSYHPVYKCEAFVGRVKAMCLWYNITKYQRLKLTLVGMMFRRLHGKTFQWPMCDMSAEGVPWKVAGSGSISGSSSGNGTVDNDVDSGVDSVDSRKLSKPIIPKVKFTIDGDSNADSSVSPTESSSSADSDSEPPLQPIENQVPSYFAQFINDVQQFRLDPISRKADEAQSGIAPGDCPASPYRRYIEHIMKSRGLGKSLSFLHKLHNVIIRKVQLTLERPGSEDAEFDADIFEEETADVNVAPIGQEQEDELRRFGVWSPEAQALDLPSYAPTFVFLSVIPLEIMHEYLRMRIESRPAMPNPLSLEQLLKEVREGLILAMTHRERFNKHIHTALADSDEALDKYMAVLHEYDVTVNEVMAMYLDYVERWVLEATPENQQKAAVVREWSFTKLIAPMIYGQHSVAAVKFANIVGRLLRNISTRLRERIEILNEHMMGQPVTNYDKDKARILLICREMQSLFTVERENALRVLHFAKTLCRDLEQRNFHRDHEMCDGEEEDESSVTGGGRPASQASRASQVGGGLASSTLICAEVQRAACIIQFEVLQLRHTLTVIIERVQRECTDVKMDDLEDGDRLVVQTRTREILHQSFKFGFDYHKELVRLLEMKIIAFADAQCQFNQSLGIIQFARMWMSFVTAHCERGRGVRPRWAAQGLEFLMAACDPVNTKHLTERDFEELKAEMDACISHVVGMVSEPEKIRKRTPTRPRKVSPNTSRPTTPTRPSMSPRVICEEQRQYFHQLSVKEESLNGGSSAPTTPQPVRKQTSCVDGPGRLADQSSASTLKVPRIGNHVMALRQIRIRDSVNQLDLHLEQGLRARNLIGQVKTLNATDKVQIRARSVHFRWHRGIKIGQGRFGKVYTAVNNCTGELMAMKEITIQPNETRAIKNVAEELKIFEGISHRYLVKYYGIEVHREELLIFMELCAEGTLESLVELSGRLHEALTRRFTAQLMTAVEQLHKHGVVHRDIKTANIFLTNGGNCLKLGDFGSAVKIQAHTTVPGELKGYVGTQAYMAPEVFTKTNSDGHGRAADIWSAGCVTIEMASGKRPWAQFDSNFQIMFKVGMGETPDVPADLSAEGHEFLEHCLEHDAKLRWSASQLLHHNFCKVDMEANSDATVASPGGVAGKGLTADRPRTPRKISTTRK